MAVNVIMVVLLAVLTVLTAALILLEIRQSTAQKLLITMANRLERMERYMDAAKKETDVPEDGGKENRTESSAGREKEHSDPSFLPFRGMGGKKPAAPSGGEGMTWDDWRNLGCRNLSGEGRAEPLVRKPALVAGLEISSVSYYNQREPVSLQELSRDKAVFFLYSDMTVRPDEKKCYAFNSAAFYINQGFTRLFDFLNQEGRPVDMQRSMKCLRVERPAEVFSRSRNHYQLQKRGILIVEEK